MKKVTIGNVTYNDGLFPLIAGPCVIESRDHSLYMAEEIQKITSSLGMPFIFKSSFDKANRTSHLSKRGVGIDEGLKISVKKCWHSKNGLMEIARYEGHLYLIVRASSPSGKRRNRT